MTKPEARVSRQNKGEPSLAEQHAALEKLRELVRQIEADRADRNAGSEQASVTSTRLRSRAPLSYLTKSHHPANGHIRRPGSGDLADAAILTSRRFAQDGKKRKVSELSPDSMELSVPLSVYSENEE